MRNYLQTPRPSDYAIDKLPLHHPSTIQHALYVLVYERGASGIYLIDPGGRETSASAESAQDSAMYAFMVGS